MSKYTCPHCGSENTSAVSLMYKNGNYETDSYQALSDFAREFSPPDRPKLQQKMPDKSNFDGCLGILFVIIMLLSFMIAIGGKSPTLSGYLEKVGIIAVVVYIFRFVWPYIANRKNKSINNALAEKYEQELIKWEHDMEKWQHLYVCLRCDHRFYVE